MNIYLIGSLRNPEVPNVANRIRALGHEVFDDWFAAGPEADDKWREYEISRGRDYLEALNGAAAKNVFAFDKRHLDAADAAVLLLPAGKSGHLELGYVIGSGRRGYVLLDTPDRWDVMYQFASGVFNNVDDLAKELGNADSSEQVSWEYSIERDLYRKAEQMGKSASDRVLPEVQRRSLSGRSRYRVCEGSDSGEDPRD